MRIGKTAVEDTGYSMHKIIARKETEKDVGVVIDNKLALSNHLAKKINKQDCRTHKNI